MLFLLRLVGPEEKKYACKNAKKVQAEACTQFDTKTKYA